MTPMNAQRLRERRRERRAAEMERTLREMLDQGGRVALATREAWRQSGGYGGKVSKDISKDGLI